MDTRTKKIFKIAHRYLVFREAASGQDPGAFELQPNELEKTLKRAVQITTVDNPVLILGLPGSGKRQMATIINEYRGSDELLVEIDCRDPDDRQRIAEILNPAAIKSPYYLSHLEEIDQESQARLVVSLENINSIARTFIFSSSSFTKMSPDFQSIFARTRLMLPPIRERRWDILPNVTLILHRRGIKYCSYNALGFFEWYSWPGNIKEIIDVISSAADSLPESKCKQDTLAFQDLKGGFPEVNVEEFRAIYREVDLSKEEFNHDIVSADFYGLIRLAVDIGFREGTDYIREIGFFERGTREIKTDPEMWGFLPTSPSFQITDLLRKIEFRKISMYPSPGPLVPYIRRAWLKNNQDAELHEERISFEEGEKVLFSVEKMYNDFKKKGVLVAKSMAPLCANISETKSDGSFLGRLEDVW